jgi:hypothetical protein
VQDKTERFFELCKLAATEQDPEKMLALITEINTLLEAKEQRLIQERAGGWVDGEMTGDQTEKPS